MVGQLALPSLGLVGKTILPSCLWATAILTSTPTFLRIGKYSERSMSQSELLRSSLTA
jgi:hypothetical protein